MSELEEICLRVHDKISSLQRLVDLSVVELPENKMRKLGLEMFALETLLEEFERGVGRQREQLKQLKKLEELMKTHVKDVHHMKDNIPAHMPMKKVPTCGNELVLKKNEATDVQPVQPDVQPENVKRANKSFIKEMEFITVTDFENIPQYMKGRVSYDQINAAVQSINKAVSAKYKILHHPVKTLSNHARKLHQRFKEQDTKDTKDKFFVVEDDIQEFTPMRVDKRFQGILTMLRHCRRLRELRGGGLTRYVLM